MKGKITPGIALSPRKTNFGPVMFTGKIWKGLEVVSEAGFKIVELSIRTNHDVNIDQLNCRLEELDLKVSAVATGQACLFDDLCLGSEDDTQRERTVEHFKKITSFAKQIKSGAIIIGGIRGRLTGSGSEYEENYEKGIGAFRKCAEWTAENDIPLLIEPINRYETNWIHTAEEGCRVLNKIGIPSVKLLLDTFHMNIEEANIVETIKKTGERIGYIHFADNTRHPPGKGQTNFRAILDALEEIDYSGPVVTEALPLPDDKTAVMNTAQFWKEMSFEL